jgi:cytoskeletal protein RodZ
MTGDSGGGEQSPDTSRKEEGQRTAGAGGAGQEQPESSRKSGRRRSRVWITIIVLAIVLILLAVAVMTVSVSVEGQVAGGQLPYSTTYAVTFPEGQPVSVGNSRIVMLSYGDHIVSDVDGSREEMRIGDERVIATRKAVITALRFIRIADTDFRISLTYKGTRDNLAYFDMTVQTSRQIPDYLVNLVLPPEIHARPVQL